MKLLITFLGVLNLTYLEKLQSNYFNIFYQRWFGVLEGDYVSVGVLEKDD